MNLKTDQQKLSDLKNREKNGARKMNRTSELCGITVSGGK